MGQGKVGTLRMLIIWSDDRPDPGRRRQQLGAVDPIVAERRAQRDPGRCRSSSAPRPGSRRASTGASCAPDDVRAATRPRRGRGAGGLEARSSARRSTATARAVTFWAEQPGPARGSRSPPGRSGTSRTRAPSIGRSPSPNAYAKLLDAVRRGDPRRGPGREDPARRDVRQLAGWRRRPKPTASEYLKQLLQASRRSPTTSTGSRSTPTARSRRRRSSEPGRSCFATRSMKQAGDSAAELWVTEVGWSSGNRREPARARQAGSGAAADARRSSTSSRTATSSRSRTSTWFAWRDLAGTPICDWCAKAGLFKADALTEKPAWSAFTNFTGGS